MDIKVIKSPNQPLINSIFIPFTRDIMRVGPFIMMLQTLEIDFPPLTEMVFYNDTDDQQVQDYLIDYLKGTWRGPAKIYMSGLPRLDEAGDQTHANRRRDRIVEMRTKAKEMIGNSAFLFLLEDDTFVSTDSLMKIKDNLLAEHDLALVSGVETGRWAYKHIGAWNCDRDRDGEIESVKSLRYGPKMAEVDYLQHCDGTGMYCMVTYTDLYKAATFRNEAMPLGPDMNYGFDLRKQGYRVAVNWGVECEHQSIFGTFLPEDSTDVVAYQKRDGVWSLNLEAMAKS